MLQSDILSHRSPVNTWERDWQSMKWDDVPDRIRAEAYLSRPVRKEEWEDEMFAKWMSSKQNNLLL